MSKRQGKVSQKGFTMFVDFSEKRQYIAVENVFFLSTILAAQCQSPNGKCSFSR